MGQSDKVRVLFVCIGNACRSPMGEAIARKEATDVIEPSSAGLYPLGMIPEMTRKTLEANGYPTDSIASKGLRGFSPIDADLIVNMSGFELPRGSSGHENVEEWGVADPYGEDHAIYQKILEDIQGRVRELAQRLRESRRTNGE